MYNLLYICSPITEQILLKTNLERLNFLNRQGNTVALKQVYAKMGENVS